MIVPLDFEELPPDLQTALRPRYERLGYLGDFFRFMGHQPDALIAFDAFTEACKHALPFDLAETISLTASTRLANDYERHQHERLAVRNGQPREWVADIETLQPDDASTSLSADQRAVQGYVLAAIADEDSAAALDVVAATLGDPTAAAVALLTARFIGHATVSHACRLQPTVPSIFDPASDV